MALLEQLKSVSLRKAKTESDFSGLKSGGFLSKEEIASYQNTVLDVNTELWMDILKDVTFPTVYCPLEFKEAQLFVKIYENNYKDIDESEVCDVNWKLSVSESELECVKDISSRLQSVMNEFTNDGYAFVKTSSRSAKDAPLVQENLKSLFFSELQKYDRKDHKDENVQITCLLKAAFVAMRVKTSDEVIEMFLRSLRIYQDLTLAIENPDRYCENFVVRKFYDIDVDMEFRCFVFQGILTALSQYNYLIYSERLIKDRRAIVSKIQKFYDEDVKPKFSDTNFPVDYVIDFAVCDGKVWVIEINPFLETTDGALFDWNKERQLLEGKEGFQERFTLRPKPGAKVMLPNSAKVMLNEVIKGMVNE